MKKWLFSLLSLVLAFSSLKAEIVEVDSAEELMQRLTSLEKDTLVVFDVDMVLIQSSNPALQLKNITKYKASLSKLWSGFSEAQMTILFNLSNVKYPPVLTDPKMPDCVRNLQSRQIPVIALTGILTGSFADIPNLPAWRIEQLSKLGFDFLKTAPSKELISFKGVGTYRGSNAEYCSGVLFTNVLHGMKGELLVRYLNQIGYFPKHLIFVDDIESNLKGVEIALEDFEPRIKFVGIHFSGALNYPTPPVNEDQVLDVWSSLVRESKNLE